MDASYWGTSFGVLVFKDAYRGKALWRKFLIKKETIADYLEGVEWLKEHNFRIRGLVRDGLRGLAQALSHYRVQYFQFHQVKTIKPTFNYDMSQKSPQPKSGGRSDISY